MKAFRKHGIAIGILFILVMAAYMIGSGWVDSALTKGINADGIYGNKFKLGIILEFINNLGVVVIAALFYPILKKQSEWAALGYAASRILESVLLMIVLALAVIPSAIGETPPGMIDTLLKSRELLMHIAMLWLGAGSILLCWVLYTSHLIPRFLSVWGMVGYTALFITSWAGLFGAPALIVNLLYIPGAAFEALGLPIWLFVKGFSERETFSN
jgi:hypothetical protein